MIKVNVRIIPKFSAPIEEPIYLSDNVTKEDIRCLAFTHAEQMVFDYLLADWDYEEVVNNEGK